MTSLDKVETIVLLMLENRAFDHLLGHLSYGTLWEEFNRSNL